PVRSPDVPNKAVERSDWYGRPQGAVAIARHHRAGAVRAEAGFPSPDSRRYRSAALRAVFPHLPKLKPLCKVRTMSLTPMMQQYQSIRRTLPANTLLLFRLGDF